MEKFNKKVICPRHGTERKLWQVLADMSMHENTPVESVDVLGTASQYIYELETLFNEIRQTSAGKIVLFLIKEKTRGRQGVTRAVPGQ